MLGLTIPDAIAFGSLCAALLAAYAGLIRGDHVSPDDEPPGMATDLTAHADAIRDLAASVAELAAALRSATSAGETRDQYDAAIGGIMRRLEERSQMR